MDRYVIVAHGPDGPQIFGPQPNRTWAGSVNARKQADAMEGSFELVEVVRVKGIQEWFDE